jgi:hypothetical protein
VVALRNVIMIVLSKIDRSLLALPEQEQLQQVASPPPVRPAEERYIH